LKSKQKKNLIKTAAFAAASISHMATAETNNTTALTEKQKTISNFVEFEKSKADSMKSLLEKLSSISTKDPILLSLQEISQTEAIKMTNRKIDDNTIYMKPQQSHSQA
jgi:hypothetical protein